MINNSQYMKIIQYPVPTPMYYVLEINKFLSYITSFYLILYPVSSYLTLLQYIGIILMFREVISQITPGIWVCLRPNCSPL